LERISPTEDLAFKKVLASEENKDILGGLIKDFFGMEVSEDEITIEKPYNISFYRELIKNNEVTQLRETVKDISASLKTANFISELQVRKTRFFDERALLYAFERYSQNYNRVDIIKRSEDGKYNKYSSLRPVYALNILGYSHFREDGDALRIFELYDPKRNKRYTKELLRIGFFELTKENTETENQKHWRDYFTKGAVNGNAPEYIKKASRIIETANLGKEELEMRTLMERAQDRYDADMYDAFYDGKDEGKYETAQNMLNDGVSIETIAKYTMLPIEKILVLQREVTSF
jgi:predicted transposase/invertase (TIGR01784 family)